MWIFYSLLSTLTPLALVGGIVATVVTWKHREAFETSTEADRGVGTAKRLYFYGSTFAYMLVAGIGVMLTARYVLDELFGPPVLRQETGQLALGVVLTVIWTPIWAWHRRRVQRFLEEEPAERRSILRKLYIYLTLGVTAALAAQASVELLRWLFGAQPFSGYAVAALVVWSTAWVFHWSAEGEEGQPSEETWTVRRLYLYVTSAYSLVMLAVGAGLIIYIVLRGVYEGLYPEPLLLQGEEGIWGDAMKNSLSVALVGAALWAYHWLYAARLDKRSDLRQLYLYILAILGGVLTTLSATGVVVFGTLQWLIGTPEEASAAAHFRFLPGALSSLVIGLSLWLCHWQTVQRERSPLGQLQAARQTYAYIMAALGLGALAASVVVLVSTATGIVVTSARDVLVGTDWWRDRIVLVLTLLLLGTPVWSFHWFLMQRMVAAGHAEERAVLPRRILIFGVVGAGTLAFLGNVSYLLFLFLNALLEGTLSLTLLVDAKWSMGAVVAAVLFVPYHWLTLQEDRKATKESAPRQLARRKSVTVLIPEGSDPFLARLETVLPGKPRVLCRLDPDVGVPELSADDFRGVERRIRDAPGGRVLLVAEATGVRVYSYR
jgi:hypothetical protein